MTAVIEAGLAGWALGAGWLGLLVAIAADGRRHGLGHDPQGRHRRPGGPRAGLALAEVLLIASADITLAAITALACAAWLVRPDRRLPFRRSPHPRIRRPG